MSHSTPELTQRDIIEHFSELERILNSVLFARIIEGERGTESAIYAQHKQLREISAWMPTFFNQLITGWLLRQKASSLEKKGEKYLLSQLKPRTIAQHVDAVNSSEEAEAKLNVTQFLALLTIGMLYGNKSVSFSLLNRETNLGGDSDIAKELSFWMFNWQPETVHGQLMWLKGNSELILDDPQDMVVNYTHQYLRFAHFVSALLVASEKRATNLKRVNNRKKTQDQVTPLGAHTILIPSGTKFKPVDGPLVAQDSADDWDMPESFADFIKGL